ncbi:MAG: ATP-binding protein [Pseudomonadota bacterium]
MIEQVYLYLILVGVTIGSVMAALWYKARKAGRVNLALIRLNEQHAFDAPSFLGGAWTLLAKSGLRGLAWRLDWFGVVAQGHGGVAKGRSTLREITVGEMSVAVTFYQHEGRGEARYFEETLIETFLLLLRMDMLIKAGTTDAALSHMSRLNLFLQHDMKNIAQFIQLMADQLASVPQGKEQNVLNYLRMATPLIRHRADRIVRTLTVGVAPVDTAERVALRPLLQQLCGLYGLAHTIDGDAEVVLAGSALETVLDNILKNYLDLGMRDNIAGLCVEIAIRERSGMTEITLQAPAAPPVPALERLFEPFWSSAPTGLGVGLYQARHIMESQGGELFVSQPEGSPLCFHVICLAAPR